jgi:cell division protein FtsL
VDNQQLFNLVVAIAGFLAVFIFYQVMQRLQKSEDKIAELERNLPHDYVQKDDYRNDVRELKEMLRQLFDKLDNKADKAA